MIGNTISFQGEELLVLPLTPNVEDLVLSALRNSLFNIFPVIVRIKNKKLKKHVIFYTN